jgi:hypothetical protein
MPHLTILQIETMIYSLKQVGQFNPKYTLEESYRAWRQLNGPKK